jgi:hypothetical protein
MVCNPADTNITMKPPGPGPSIPGLGLPFSVPKIPFPDLSLPEGVPEDLIELINTIFAMLPGGIKFQPDTDSMTKGIWDALASLFNKLAPFLGIYKFFQALLNIILCIIDVFCALMNPWSTLRAVRRLFKRCLPDFLSLFPWIALLVMILALILLLIALIEYIISVIIAYIKQIIKNLTILARAISVHDEQAILAAVQKISFLLCLIEQLFTILMGIAALLAIIEPLMGILGRSVCSGGDRRGNGAGDCCTPDFCPAFIRNNPDGLTQATGRLIYQSKIDQQIPSDSIFNFMRGANFQAIRPQRWQFTDDHPTDYKFLDIITPSPEYGFIYWPNNDVFPRDAALIRVPYKLDMTMLINPAHFGNPDDLSGDRLMNIRDVIVTTKPTQNAVAWNNGQDSSTAFSGCLSLVGGLVYEFTNDGYAPYLINGVQASLETLVSKPAKSMEQLPTSDDGYNFFDINYQLKVNHEVLIQYGLIGLMCQPETAAESAVLNAEYNDMRSVLDKVGVLPDVNGTITCLTHALSKFRGDLNEDTAETFQQEAVGCLNALKNQALDFYARGTAAATDRFSSDFELYPNVQFINNDIKVTVRLRDKSGNQLATNINTEAAAGLSAKIRAVPTFGDVSEFTYDGYGDFIAELHSEKAGTGEIRAYIDNEVIASVINRDSEDTPSEIVDRVLTYEFIDKVSYSYRGDTGDYVKQRFDESDVAEDGS